MFANFDFGIAQNHNSGLHCCRGHLQPSALRRCNPLLNRFTWKLLPPKLDLVEVSKFVKVYDILLPT